MNRIRPIGLAAALILSASALPAAAQTLFLNDAVLAPGDRTETSDVIIRDGQVLQVASDLDAPSGATTIEGAWLTPGLFAVDSSVGLVEIGGESDTNDRSASSDVVSVDQRAADSFNPRSTHIDIVRRQGITHALVLPTPGDGTIFGGTGLVADLSGRFDSVVSDRAVVHIALGETGADKAGGSRSAALGQLRAAFDDADRGIDGRDSSNVLSRLDAAALADVLSGDMPLAIRASRASDLVGLAALSSDFPSITMIVFGAEEAYLVLDQLADANMAFVVDPLQNLPNSFDSTSANFANFSALTDAGLNVAIANTSSLGVTRAQALRQHAGNAVARGAQWDDAFAAITSVPAGWFGVEDTGLVVWDGDPLEVTSAPIHMILGGQFISLESRQSLLRDRYNPSREDDRPHKYR